MNAIRNLLVALLVPAICLSAGQGSGAFASGDTEAKVEISFTLSAAISMALANNLDLRLAGYDPLILDEEIGRALSEFDPTFTGNFGYASERTPSFSTIIPTTRTRTWDLDVGLGTKTLTGASLSLSARSVKTNTNNVFLSSESPFYTTRLSVAFVQPLMSNAGLDVNRAGIIIAQNNYRIGAFEFEEQVMQLVLDVINAYWNLLGTQEDLKAKDRSLQSAQDFLRNTRIRLDAGDVPAIEVTRARARVAERQEAIVTARALIKDAEDALRRLLGPRAMPILSTDDIIPADAPTVYAEQLELSPSVNYALSTRPTVLRQRLALESYDVLLARSKNQLLPQVDLFATYSLNGLGSTWNADYEMLGTLDYREVGAGVALSIPVGNRRARSNYSQTRYRRLQVLAAYAITERDVTLSVKKAIRDVSTSLQTIESNRVRVQASEEQLEAERQKYDVGQSISLDVLDAQEALQEAETALIRSIVQFKRAMARYRRQTGSILEDYNIRVLAPTNLTRRGQHVFP